MIGINADDQNFLCFLWLESPYDPNCEIIYLRFTHLVFGLKPSPAVLGAVFANHICKYQDQYPEMAYIIQDSLYVDDLVTGVDSDE